MSKRKRPATASKNGQRPDPVELLQQRLNEIREVEESIGQLQQMLVQQSNLLQQRQGQLFGVMQALGWTVDQVNEALGEPYLSVVENEPQPSPTAASET